MKTESSSLASVATPGVSCWTVDQADSAGLIVDACAYYRCLYDLLRCAQRYVVLVGWQFDRNVELVRDASHEGESRLIPLLNELCVARPDLQVFLLAWDYNVIYAGEREWWQALRVEWQAHERLQFLFDSSHPVGASHHQKFVIIDGHTVFTGGMDVCDHRWDTRAHGPSHPARHDLEGQPYGPYHDVQVGLRGPVVARFVELFCERWRQAGGCPLGLPDALPAPGPLACTIPLPPGPVALSRTQGATVVPLREPLEEIARLYERAILASQELIYLENQYMSARNVYGALVRRFLRGGPPVSVAVLLPRTGDNSFETLALKKAQNRQVHTLGHLARLTGHHFAAYCTAPLLREGLHDTCATYIHSKVMVVDDRFLTVGSANATNRSMGLDTELNVSWEETSGQLTPLTEAIREVRTDLLTEHCGLITPAWQARLREGKNLVTTLNELASQSTCRLLAYPEDTEPAGTTLLENVARAVGDPASAWPSATVMHQLVDQPTGVLARMVHQLNEWVYGDQTLRLRKGECTRANGLGRPRELRWLNRER